MICDRCGRSVAAYEYVLSDGVYETVCSLCMSDFDDLLLDDSGDEDEAEGGGE